MNCDVVDGNVPSCGIKTFSVLLIVETLNVVHFCEVYNMQSWREVFRRLQEEW